jgi:putative hemolysin
MRRFGGYSVACLNADCFGPITSSYNNRGDCVAAWNRRATPSDAADRIRTLSLALAEAEKQRDEAIALKYDVAMDALLYRANIVEAKIDALLAKNAELKEYIQELENDYC